MKPIVLCLVVSLSLATLVVAILLKGNKEAAAKKKEGFLSSGNEFPIGMAVTVALVLVVFMVAFFSFYSFPKAPNVLPRNGYYNLM